MADRKREATEREAVKEQMGGSPLKVTNRSKTSGLERFKNAVETISLDVDIPSVITSSPNGAQLFGDAIVDLVRRNVPSGMVPGNLKTGVKFESSEITESVGLSFKMLSKVSSEDVVQAMEAMAQSNKSVLKLEVPKLTVHITYLNPPSGSGSVASEEGGESSTTMFTESVRRPAVGRKRKSFGIEDILAMTTAKRRREEEREGAVDFLDNEAGEAEEDDDSEDEDELGDVDFEDMVDEVRPKGRHIMRNNVSENCLPHALHQSLMYHEWKRDKLNKKKIKQYRDTLRVTSSPNSCVDVFSAARQLKKVSGVTKSSNFDRMDIAQFQEKCFAGQFQIIVFAKNSTVPYYAGPFVGRGRQLALYLSDGHYSGLRSVCALLKTKYYCGLCNSRYRDAASHYACRLLHRPCGQEKCHISSNDVEKKCPKCFVTFRSEICYENHLIKGSGGGKSRCDFTRFCKKCSTSYYWNKNCRPHVCGESFCHRCQIPKMVGHKCTMMPSLKNEKYLTRKRGFFDVESRKCPETGKQIPVLFKCLKCCPQCSDKIPKNLLDAQKEICSNCSPDGRLKVIETVSSGYVNVAEEMAEWIFSDRHRGFVFVAHNSSGYDGQFLLEAMIASNKANPEICLDGTRLIFMKYNHVRLVDSLKYLTMSLSAVGKTFQVDVVKGDFPVHFIRPENYDYEGPIPDNEWYALENKSPTARKQLEEFLEKERKDESKVFNFFSELCKYCYNDVYLLATAMTKFEKAFEAMTNVCLLEETTTAASAAALVFRRNHLDPSKPIVLDSKPSASINSSILSQKYLAWISASEDVQVNMSTTYGEKKIGNHRVDGYIPPCEKYPDGQIIEYYGCYYHAHTCSYSEESVIGGKGARDIWAADEERIKKLEEESGCPVRVVHECHVKEELRQNAEMAEFFENYEALDLLQCERALVGGRTEVFRVYVMCEGKIGHYLDVVSLYPTVMKHEAYPIGEPENVDRSTLKTPMTAPEDLPFEGFLSCKINAPRDLQLPVIAGKVSGRLMFFLCRRCAKEGNQFNCSHSEEERSFTGTFTTVELKKALSLGYKITQVFHGVKYEKWVKNGADGAGGLFTTYINSMMEEKIYSSGWPADVKTEEEKARFCKGYLEKEKITLDPSRFELNAGKRAVAKLMLNSLWGKFAQRVDRQNTIIVVDPGVFWGLVHDTSLEIRDVRPVNDVLVVKYRQKEETLSSLKTSAIHLAAYTTAYARLRLYRLMETVGPENIIYTDTDSIIFTTPEGAPNPLKNHEGPYLGQLTNELHGKMSEFVSLGPKTYSYKEKLEGGNEKVVIKAKGITINSEVEKMLNFNEMKVMVDEVLNSVEPRTNLLLPQHVMVRNKEHQVFSKNIVKRFQYTFNKRRLLSDGSTLPFGYC